MSLFIKGNNWYFLWLRVWGVFRWEEQPHHQHPIKTSSFNPNFGNSNSANFPRAEPGQTHLPPVCVCENLSLPAFPMCCLPAWRVSVFSLCIILAPGAKSHILLCLVARWRNVIMGFSNNLSIELEELSCTSDSELQHFISSPVNQPCVGEDASNVWSLSDTLIICFCLIDSFTSPSTLQPGSGVPSVYLPWSSAGGQQGRKCSSRRDGRVFLELGALHHILEQV